LKNEDFLNLKVCDTVCTSFVLLAGWPWGAATTRTAL
jgi:hypothetical protein